MSPSNIVRSLDEPTSPPWEVVELVAQILDPKTLASASCVCKSWLSFFSTDHLWEPISRSEFPSVSNLKSRDPTVPYRTLYSLGFSAAKRRVQAPPKPSLNLSNLIFSVEIFNAESNAMAGQLWISGAELEAAEPKRSVFQFDVVSGGAEVDEAERFKVVWNVVLSEWRGMFCLMECEAEVRVGGEVWFSAEVAAAGCCCRETGGAGSGLVADLRLGFCRGDNGDDEKKRVMKVSKVSIGLLSSVSWRYVCMEDGLRYLQHFL